MDPITGATRLRLFPIVVTASADRYLVIRRDTGKMLQTSASGVESIRLLRKGLTIDRTHAAIGVKYGCDLVNVDIMPLVERLLGADFVEAIDGRRISVRRSRVSRALRGMYVAYLHAPVVSALIRWGPLGAIARLMLRPRPSRDPAAAEQIARNMRRVPALAVGDDHIERLAAENSAALRGFYFERLLLAALPPARLDRWMHERVRIDGLAHLDRAIAAGHGVILCAFHVNAYSMIPFILASRGYAQTVLMEATDDSTREIRARITELRDAGYRYAIEPVAAPRGVHRIARGLKRGTTALLLFDPTVDPSREHVTEPLLGASLRVARGVAWLALRASAPVLPVSIWTEGPGRYHLDIHGPLTELERSTEGTILATLARALERGVLARPAAWLKWKDLHIMVDRSTVAAAFAPAVLLSLDVAAGAVITESATTTADGTTTHFQVVYSVHGQTMRVHRVRPEDQGLGGLIHLYDAAAGRVVILDRDKQEAEIHDAARASAEVEKHLPSHRISGDLTPTGRTRQLLGVACEEYSFLLKTPRVC